MTDELATHGVRVAVPPGWEAELGLLDDGDGPPGAGRRFGTSSVGSGSGDPRVVLHLANFVLPVERGDYGSGAVELMDGGGVLIVVLEFDRASARTALFATDGVPRGLHPDDFSTNALQRPRANQAGVQRFFHVGDRAFCLYVVLGSHRARAVLVAEANRLLGSLEIV